MAIDVKDLVRHTKSGDINEEYVNYELVVQNRCVNL